MSVFSAPTQPKSSRFSVMVSAVTAFCAGIVNGLLGTGGGIPLLFLLRRHTAAQDAFASALCCILPLSILSAWLYVQNGTFPVSALLSSDIFPYLLGAIFGGILGAVLLDRLKLSVVQMIFAALLLFSGWRMAFSSGA